MNNENKIENENENLNENINGNKVIPDNNSIFILFS